MITLNLSYPQRREILYKKITIINANLIKSYVYETFQSSVVIHECIILNINITTDQIEDRPIGFWLNIEIDF